MVILSIISLILLMAIVAMYPHIQVTQKLVVSCSVFSVMGIWTTVVLSSIFSGVIPAVLVCFGIEVVWMVYFSVNNKKSLNFKLLISLYFFSVAVSALIYGVSYLMVN